MQLLFEWTRVRQFLDLAEHFQREPQPAAHRLVAPLPAILEAKSLLLGEIALLLEEQRIEHKHEAGLGKLDDRPEMNVGRSIVIGFQHRPLGSALKRQAEPIAIARDELDLAFELDRVQAQLVIGRLIECVGERK